MPSCFRKRVKLIALGLVVGLHLVAQAFDPVADMAALYGAHVDRRLDVPQAEAEGYARLAEAALAKAGLALDTDQYLLVVDRDAHVQAVLMFFRTAADSRSRLVGASPVSTGRPGSFDHFTTPVGVFEHSPVNPDFRAEGTRNELGIMGYGAKGMRVFDFGWQPALRGWGAGGVSDMRLQMHATDPGLLEPRLGSIQSKGCIRIPASLNRLIDHYGVLDAGYLDALREGEAFWVIDPQREPVPVPGRYLIVVDTGREARPAWSPGPEVAKARPAKAITPAVKPAKKPVRESAPPPH